MAEDRDAAVAAWHALPAESRRRAWAAAAEPTAIEDPELAAVAARYALAMRGRVPQGFLILALAALFAWLALAGFWITHGRTGLGVALGGAGVIAAGLGIGGVQVRQANFDRLYACAVAAPGLRARRRRRTRRAPLTNVGGSADSPWPPETAESAPPPATRVSRRVAKAEPLGGQPGGLPDREQAEQEYRADEDAGLDGVPVDLGGVRDPGPHHRTGDEPAEMRGDGDVRDREREDQVDDDRR
jgi:hypothetical protein